jgi:MerR family transcriptional regulator, heat shock protein HspR
MYQSNNDNGQTNMLADDRAVFTIGMVAEMLKVHPRTIRNYEANGLITPSRKGSWRYYTMRDVQWVECLREMIHTHGVSINAIKKLLKYTPCWNIIDCPFEKRKRCSAFFSNSLIPKKIERLPARSVQKDAVA